MKRKFTTSFDELIRNYYGDSSRSGVKDAVTIEELFANYYGKSAIADEENKKSQPTLALSLCRDDGEILSQRSYKKRVPRYGYQQSMAAPEFEEYVVGDDALATQSSVAEQRDVVPARDTGVFEEYTVDVLAPLEETTAAGSSTAPDSYQSQPAAPRAAPPATAKRPPIETGDSGETSRAKASDDDFIADMQSILSGQMAFDPLSKQMVEKDKLSGAPSSPSPNYLPVPQGGDGQAIFDRIAQSMQYANAYDLGTVELENRFSDFDRMSELQQKAAQDKKKELRQSSAREAEPAPRVDSEDFIQDLDAIRQEHYGSGGPAAIAESFAADIGDVFQTGKQDAACIPWALSLSSTESAADYSRPLYDAGEHSLAGWDLYSDQLRVGKNPGVAFSYGHLIAMGDLYETVNQMMDANVGELQTLKTLLDRSQRYYKGHRADGSLDVSDAEWEKATNKRYLDLAEDNYAHFAPNNLFKSDPWVKNVGKHPNNKSAWEYHHKRAIEEAQKMFLDPKNANASPFLEYPLIINAFGDHFLTDAFAAGHNISKDATIEHFKFNFYNGGKLKSQAATFFERVAKKAFKGEVERKFSVLETYDPVFLWWNPNIDTVNAFRTLLIGIAEQKPDEIGNLAVKALHDILNKQGIEVFNEAGDGTWKLTGDGTLDTKNLGIIKKAVQQSVDNVNDPSIRASNLNFGSYFAKVWKHIPQLTEESKKKVRYLSDMFTSPDSDMLVDASAEIITKKVNLFIRKLLDAKKLKPA